MTMRAKVVIAAMLVVSSCHPFGDPGYAEFVVNHSDRAFVVRYEPRVSGDPTLAFAIPALSSGIALGDSGETWQGTLFVMSSDCAPLGRLQITANPTLLIFAPDGSFSLTTEQIVGRGDIDANVRFPLDTACWRTTPPP